MSSDRGILGNYDYNRGREAGRHNAGDGEAKAMSEICDALHGGGSKDYRAGYNRGWKEDRHEDKKAEEEDDDEEDISEPTSNVSQVVQSSGYDGGSYGPSNSDSRKDIVVLLVLGVVLVGGAIYFFSNHSGQNQRPNVQNQFYHRRVPQPRYFSPSYTERHADYEERQQRATRREPAIEAPSHATEEEKFQTLLNRLDSTIRKGKEDEERSFQKVMRSTEAHIEKL